MRSASAPYEHLAVLATLLCLGLDFPAFSYGLPALPYFFWEPSDSPSLSKGSVKASVPHFSQRGQHRRPAVKMRGSTSAPTFYMFERLSQIKSATAKDKNGNNSEQLFSPSAADESKLDLHQRGSSFGEYRNKVGPVERRVSEQSLFENSFVASVSGDEHVFLPVVDGKYAKAAMLINEYVARDSLLFDDPDGPCPQANWMRVDGRAGRCFKSFDFAELRSRESAEGYPVSKSYGTWEEAERLCMTFGAHLAALHTAAETRFAHMVLDRRPDACWIGLRRAQPPGRRRHEDASNGWKWITSDRGILEDSDPLEWTRDWQPVWDSISYGPQLCGVFTRKGIAARRCYPVSNNGSRVEGRRRRNGAGEGDRKSPTGLSCFLCATVQRGSRLPVNSYARAAEEGNFDWQAGEDPSKEIFPIYVQESSYYRPGSNRFREERKGSREPRNDTHSWTLRQQDRLTKRESRINSSHKQEYTDATEGQGYHFQEGRGHIHRTHAMRGEHRVDGGRLRREENDDLSARYIGLPALVDTPSTKAVSGRFDVEFAGQHRSPTSGAKKKAELRVTSSEDSEENMSEGASGKGPRPYRSHVANFDSTEDYEEASEGEDSHNREITDDLEAEAAWLAHTSASMRDQKTYSEFLRRFMEMQRRKQLQRKEEAFANNGASSVAAGKESDIDELDLSPQRTSRFPDVAQTFSPHDRTTTEGMQEHFTGVHDLAVHSVEEETLTADESADISSTADLVLASERQSTSDLLEYSSGSLGGDALNNGTESRTAQWREDRKRQRRFLLGIACGCGVGGALALAALVLACMRCRVSPLQSEGDGTSAMDDKKDPFEERELTPESAGTAADSTPSSATARREGAPPEKVCPLKVHSLNSKLSSINRPSCGMSLETQNPNTHVIPGRALEQKGNLRNSTESRETEQSTAATVGVDPASFTGHQGLATPLECELNRHQQQSRPCKSEEGYCHAAPWAEECRVRHALSRRPSLHSGDGSSDFAGCINDHADHTGLYGVFAVNTPPNYHGEDFAREYENPGASNCSSSHQDGDGRPTGAGRAQNSRDAEDKRELLIALRPQNIRGDTSEDNTELCVELQGRWWPVCGEEEHISHIYVAENFLKPCLTRTVGGETPKRETVFPAASGSACAQTSPGYGIQTVSRRTETPCTASFPSAASVSDVSWKEHLPALLYQAEECTSADWVGSEGTCSLAMEKRDPGEHNTSGVPPYADASFPLADKPTLTAMERLLRLRLKIGAM